DPQGPVAVFENRGDAIAAQARRVVVAVAENLELLGVVIVVVEPAFARADPKATWSIVQERRDRIIRNRALLGVVVLKDTELVSVVAGEAVAGSYPNESRRVLNDGVGRELRQS